MSSSFMTAVALAAALTSAGAVEWDGKSYVFGGLVIDTYFDMAYHGPFKSDVGDCSSSSVDCLRTNFLVLAAPRGCAPLQVGESFDAAGHRFEVLGQVSSPYDWEESILLLASPAQKNAVIGFQTLGGIQNLILDFTSDADLYRTFKTAATEGRLQDEYDKRDKQGKITLHQLFGCRIPLPTGSSDNDPNTPDRMTLPLGEKEKPQP